MATITLERVTRIHLGNDKPSVDQPDLKIKDGEFPVLVSPSDCGRSTPLCMLAGLGDVNEGHIFVGDKDVTDVPPRNRDIAMVLQSYALCPYMTVRESMGFALKITGTPKEEIAKRAEETAHILDLEPYLDRKPKALSGGQRQRVTVGCAIVRKSQVFLMDEPLSNLDAELRIRTCTQIAPLQRQLGVTTAYITRDQTEVLTMGGRIAVFKDGLLQQVGSPQEMCEHPANEFVAGFIGSPAISLGKFKVEGSTAALGPARILSFAATVNTLIAEDKSMIMTGFRLEGLELVSETEANSIPIQVDFAEELGPDAFVHDHLAGMDGQGIGLAEEGSSKQFIVCVPPRIAPACGDAVYTCIIAGQRHSFSASTDMRLPG